MSGMFSSTVIRSASNGVDRSVRGSAAQLSAQGRQGARAVGAMFFSFFGAAWLLIACHLAHRRGLIAVALVFTGALMLALGAVGSWRKRRRAMRALRQTPESRRIKRRFRAINAMQWISISVAVYLLRRAGLEAWIVPVMMLIVGVHFLPLARVFRYAPHYLTGAVLIGTAVLYPVASPGGPGSPLGSLIAGLTLWLAALWALRPLPR